MGSRFHGLALRKLILERFAIIYKVVASSRYPQTGGVSFQTGWGDVNQCYNRLQWILFHRSSVGDARKAKDFEQLDKCEKTLLCTFYMDPLFSKNRACNIHICFFYTKTCPAGPCRS